MSGESPLEAKANFLLGDDPARWRANIGLFQAVRYNGLYAGIDMKYGGTGRRLKSEFLLAPGADPDLIRVRYAGADDIALDGGSLVFRFQNGELREDSPEAYQVLSGRRVPVKCHYALHADGTVGFALGKYDTSLELIIDPVLSYSTYLGGSGFDAVTGLAVDSSGNAFVTGYTDSLDFPIAGAIQGATGGGVDAFVVKLNPAGNALLYATYIGGSGDDRARGLALDASGNVIITGSTTSQNFPRVAAYQTIFGGGRDAFVTKLNATGNLLVFSTYFGGSGYDSGNAIASDSSGSVYIAGDTYSTNLPVMGAMQSLNAGRQDGFAAKFSSAGALQYSTYLGGAGDDRGVAIAVDTAGAAYITGNTTSANFPVANAFQPANAGGQDAFVTKLNAAGTAIVYSTYLGGSGGIPGYPESGNGIGVDSAQSAYVTGVTHSANFPKLGALQTGHAGGGLDAFVCKFTPAGSALVYGTFLGGIGLDTATAIAIDSGGIAYVTGNTTSPDFPMINPLQSSKSGSVDSFVVAVDPAGASLLFSTFFGGNSSDGGTAIALNGSGKVWMAGQTTSTNFPVLGPVQATGFSEGNGFISSIAQVVTQKAAMTTPAPGSVLTGASVTFTWTNTGATQYALDVGTTVGGTNITTGSVGTATSKTVSGIPVDGSTIYVRLSTNIAGVWQFFDYTYTAVTSVTKATMTSPVPSTTLSGATITFTWTNTGASQYALDVGTSVGGTSITSGSVGAVTSKTVNGIPVDGSTIYVRLSTNIAGVWQFFDYTYTAFTTVTKATMTSPVPSTTLSGAAVTFTWTSTGASQYALDVGTAPGGTNITTGSVGTATSKAVSGIPVNGIPIYVRLSTNIAGIWQFFDYTYTAATVVTKAVMISPTPSSTLPGATVTFTWTNTGSSQYSVDIGTAFAGNNITTGSVGTATSKTVSGIPTNGGTIYVRLWTTINGVPQGNDYTYTAASQNSPKAVMISPVPSTTLTGSAIRFIWNSTSASDYWLEAGTSIGQTNLFTADQGLATSKTLTSLPLNGSTIYVRLWSYFSGGWQFNDYTYTASGAENPKAVITSPEPSSKLTGSTIRFIWNNSGTAAYRLDVGTTFGSGNILTGTSASLTSKTVSGLPLNGSTVYVRLWSLVSGVWQSNDYTYIAATVEDPKSYLLSPEPSSKLTGSTVAFTRSNTGAASYWLDVSLQQGTGDIFAGTFNASTTLSVSNIPSGSRTIYVRLWTQLNSGWQWIEYTFIGPN